MRRRICLCLLPVLLLAACGSDAEPAPSPSAGQSGEATSSPSPSATPAPTSAAPPGGGVPDARTVDVAQFLRAGTSKVAVVYGDMNGVAPEEIVVHSRANQPGPDGLSAQEYVDAYSWDPGRKAWSKVFDATTFADLPTGGGKVLDPGEGYNQAVADPLAMVDFAGDGTPELVLAVAHSGASAGPLALWIFSWLSESFTAEFTVATERGGSLKLNPDKTLTLEAGEYGPNDPGCCPSQTSTRTIGYNPNTKMVGVLKTVLTPNPTS